MELNREQIIKALECCYDNNLSCSDCPFQATDKYLECSGLVLSALSLIKQLTEENERLKPRVLEENHLRHQAEELLALGMSEVKADTVRKMQERLKKEAVYPYVESNIQIVTTADIDQIAKEMLEGGE